MIVHTIKMSNKDKFVFPSFHLIDSCMNLVEEILKEHSKKAERQDRTLCRP